MVLVKFLWPICCNVHAAEEVVGRGWECEPSPSSAAKLHETSESRAVFVARPHEMEGTQRQCGGGLRDLRMERCNARAFLTVGSVETTEVFSMTLTRWRFEIEYCGQNPGERSRLVVLAWIRVPDVPICRDLGREGAALSFPGPPTPQHPAKAVTLERSPYAL
jgi:hypothetical protein